MQTEVQKLSVTEKIGYSLGDLAANLIFQTLMTFLALYPSILKLRRDDKPVRPQEHSEPM